MKEPVTIVSYGGGTNSTAMLIGLAERKIRVDYILFADTGGEKPETYHYIRYFNNWLFQNGMPQIITVKYQTKFGVEMTLEQDIINNKVLPSIAYGFKTCSQKYKIEPIEKWLKKNIEFGEEKPVKMIGFDAHEHRRMRDDPNGKYINKYPLIEWDWDRTRCIEEIIKAGLCLPGKSSCFFCPNSKKGEVLTLDPDLQKRAMFIEENAKDKLTDIKGLGRRWSWTDLIKADKQQESLFDDLDLYQNPCECID